MKQKLSAGILLFRRVESAIQVLLVHPGGPYFRNKDMGSWSIPKGLVDDEEDKLAAAKREFREELGQDLKADQFIVLTPIKQKGGKMVYAWAAEGDVDASQVVSNTFRMEYPYKSGKWMDVPEIDKAEWFGMEEAKQKINPAQAGLLGELLQIIAHEKAKTE